MAYFCHQCQRIVNVGVTPDLHCRICNGDFVEEVNSHGQSADSDDAAGNTGNDGPLPLHQFGIIRQHVEPVDAENPPLSSGLAPAGAAQNPFLNILNPDLFVHNITRILQQQTQPQPASNIFIIRRGNIMNRGERPGRSFGDAPSQPPTSMADGSSTTASGSGTNGGRPAGGNPAPPNNENAVNFISQLISNLVENTNNGSAVTRLTFHFGDSLPQQQPQGAEANVTGGPMPFGLPFLQNIIHGNINDYAWGPEGLDAIATQLLNQFDNGPVPHVSPADLQRLPMTEVTEVHVKNETQCAICMETFQLKEEVSQLDCRHIFHRPCIEPWLKKQNTCPICRKVVDPKTWGNSGADTRPTEIVDVDELD